MGPLAKSSFNRRTRSGAWQVPKLMTVRFDPCGESLGDPALVRSPFRLASPRGGLLEQASAFQHGAALRIDHRPRLASKSGRSDGPPIRTKVVGLTSTLCNRQVSMPMSIGSPPIDCWFHAPGNSSEFTGRSHLFDFLKLPPSDHGREIGKRCLAGASSL